MKQNIALDLGIRAATHRVMVRSTHTQQGDSKTFRVHAPMHSNETLCELIRQFVKQSQEDGELHEFVMFTNEKKKNTHILIVNVEYSKHARKESMRSFRMCCPSFNSLEIADIIQRFLTGGKK